MWVLWVFNAYVGMSPADCLFLVACWPCFRRKWTLRWTTALFMVDASAPSNTREATGPPMFICHVRPTLCSSQCHPSANIYLHHVFLIDFFKFASSDHPKEDFLELLEELLSLAGACGVALSPQEEFHLSVSQTVVLRHHWIQPVTQSLRAGLVHCKRFAHTKCTWSLQYF